MIASVIGKCFRVYLFILTNDSPRGVYRRQRERDEKPMRIHNAAHAPVYGHNALSLSIMREFLGILHTHRAISIEDFYSFVIDGHSDERRVSK